MTDYSQFRQLAYAAFSDLNLSIAMFEQQNAISTSPVYYRIKAEGMKIGPVPLIAQCTSAESAIAKLVVLVAQARRARRSAADQRATLARAA